MKSVHVAQWFTSGFINATSYKMSNLIISVVFLRSLVVGLDFDATHQNLIGSLSSSILPVTEVDKIDVSFNNLESFASDWNVMSLSELHMAHNSFRSISGDILCNLTDLLILNAEYNALESIPEVTCNITVQTMLLRGNNISQISTTSAPIGNRLVNYHNLTWLDLSDNLLLVVEGISQLSGSLEHLDLSNNQLSTLGSELHELTHITWLDLHNNSINTAGYQTFGGLLSWLDLSDNMLSSVPAYIGYDIGMTMKTWNLSENNIITLIDDNVDSFTKLEMLVVDQNDLDTLELCFDYHHDPNQDFPKHGIDTTLRYVSANQNKLTHISARIRCPMLTEVSLDKNPLSGWPDLSHLNILHTLSLRMTNIASLPPEEQLHLANVTSLRLDGNYLSSWAEIEGILNASDGLINMSLSNNDLMIIKTQFIFKASLRHVDLSYNHLQCFPEVRFNHRFYLYMLIYLGGGGVIVKILAGMRGQQWDTK